MMSKTKVIFSTSRKEKEKLDSNLGVESNTHAENQLKT